jgi:hypothetical protein
VWKTKKTRGFISLHEGLCQPSRRPSSAFRNLLVGIKANKHVRRPTTRVYSGEHCVHTPRRSSGGGFCATAYIETKVFVSLQKLANEEKHALNMIARPTEAVYRWCRHKEPQEPRRRDSNSNRDDATRRAKSR